ncbi:17731_t:CDS:2, partial [Racocetra fulgida]
MQTYAPINIDLDEVKTFVTFAVRFATENLLHKEYNKMKNNLDKNVRPAVKSTSTGKNAKNSIFSSFKKHKPATVEELSDYLKLKKIDFDCDPFA